VYLDVQRCVRAVQARDERFDGWFFTAVLTTGIYCRPSCPATPPKPENMRFFPSAAAAQQAGFRACKRCRPGAVPGSPQWNERADLVARAMRLIADGLVDREGVPGLATRLGYSVRQLERQLMAELGAGPLALARAQRAQTARLLIETTTLPMTDLAYAAGFASVRAFNETVREVFALSPSELRVRAQTRAKAGDEPGAPGRTAGSQTAGSQTAGSQTAGSQTAGTIVVRLPFRRPLCPDNLFGHLAATAVPGIEEWRDGAYRRTLRLPHGHAVATLRPAPEHVECRLALSDLRDLTTAINRCRWLLDLDADPVAIDALLGADEALAPLVAKSPGRRVPRTTDPAELAIRAVLGQQVSTAAARRLAARLVTAHGEPVEDADGALTHLFPTVSALAELDPETLAMPRSRRATVLALVAALAAGELELDVGGDWERARAQLAAVPGVGPWTGELVAMRALGDPDAFVATDLGVRRAASELGLPSTPAALTTRATPWRPWRAYAVQYLWATSDHPINQLPAD